MYQETSGVNSDLSSNLVAICVSMRHVKNRRSYDKTRNTFYVERGVCPMGLCIAMSTMTEDAKISAIR